MLEIPLLEDEIGSWFIGSLDLGSMVSIIRRTSISCALENIDLVCKIFKILLDGSSGCFGAPLFEHVQHRRPTKF